MVRGRAGVVLRVTWLGMLWASACGPAVGVLVGVFLTLADPGWMLSAIAFGAAWGLFLGVPVGLVLGVCAGVVLAALVGPRTPERAALGACLAAPVLALVVLASPGQAEWLVASAVPVSAVAAWPMWRATVSTARSYRPAATSGRVA